MKKYCHVLIDKASILWSIRNQLDHTVQNLVLHQNSKGILWYVYFSGMFPLYKPGASSMGGAYLRAHVTAKPQFGKVDQVRFCIARS